MNLTVQASSVSGKMHSVSTDYVLKVLGLDVCSETVVGNDMLRGVSGGQRKRVTTGISLTSSHTSLSRHFPLCSFSLVHAKKIYRISSFGETLKHFEHKNTIFCLFFN